MKNGFKYNSVEDKNFIYIDDAKQRILVYDIPKPFYLKIVGRGQSKNASDQTIPLQLVNVLRALIMHPERVYRRDEIAKLLNSSNPEEFEKRGGYAQQDQTVNVRMHYLRKKLGKIMGKKIETEYGGYVYHED